MDDIEIYDLSTSRTDALLAKAAGLVTNAKTNAGHQLRALATIAESENHIELNVRCRVEELRHLTETSGPQVVQEFITARQALRRAQAATITRLDAAIASLRHRKGIVKKWCTAQPAFNFLSASEDAIATLDIAGFPEPPVLFIEENMEAADKDEDSGIAGLAASNGSNPEFMKTVRHLMATDILV